MYFSDSESSDDVASSITRMFLFSNIALAIAILCLSHHESLIHLSHTKLSYQSFNSDMKSWHFAIFAAAMISLSVALRLQYAIFSLIVLWNRIGS
jgi:hypothetical protein